MTWPLARVLPTHIAGDLGDPLFNGWVLHWTGGELLRVFHGDLGGLSSYWHGNIFYPASLAIARSEHLTPQTLQALPIIAATHNIVLAYNLLLLSSIVLAGLGTFLLVRDLTARPLAAFAAGVAFAFAPFRLDQWSHLDVLSSQWMPFALFGLRRFAAAGRVRALAGGATAVVVQALSCLYYLGYFAPFAALYAVFEVAAHGRLRDLRTWKWLVAAGAAASLVIGLFLWPYFLVRRGADQHVRDITEVQQFSADTHAFATVSSDSRVWGTVMRAMPRNENQGFPGLTIVGLAMIGVVAAVRRSVRDAAAPGRTPLWRRVAAWAVGAVLVGDLVLLGHLLITGSGTMTLAGLVLRFRYRPDRILLQFAALVSVLMLLSPAARRSARRFVRMPEAFFACAAVVCALLSLGPIVYAGGRELGPGLYSLLYRLPGFEAFRVASLFFMLVALFLAVLAGFGAAAIGGGRWGRAAIVVVMLMMVGESWSAPVETHAPPQVVVHGLSAEPIDVYRWVRDLPDGAVIAELPFGATFDEIGYTYAAGYHRKPIVNGYSGFYPKSYVSLLADLSRLTPAAWSALRRSGATHVIVRDEKHADWLRDNGAKEVAAFTHERVFRLP